MARGGQKAESYSTDVLTDFKKAFGTVNRSVLWDRATEEEYPLDALVLSLNAWRRMTSAEHLIPTRGVGAGAADTTYELARYLLAPLRRAKEAITNTDDPQASEQKDESGAGDKPARRRITGKSRGLGKRGRKAQQTATQTQHKKVQRRHVAAR